MRIKYSWLMKRRAMFCTDIKKEKKEKEIRSNFTDVRREKGGDFLSDTRRMHIRRITR